ncbi:InlB B-repeat-containing protein, partial [Candidatus Symbiothrix dinenymphae]|uniref:InlB B-repeat-containing protein n=1 Tax=Candidatus Symbiothrix dinenymphae TaxID=467085 RepID=UPI001396250C
GWYREAACTNAWNFNTDGVTGDITLYAKWVVRVDDAAAPAIITQPVSGEVISGNAETLTVEAISSDGGTLSYQWYENNIESNTDGYAIAGATEATYNTPTDLTAGVYYYYVEVTNTNNSVNGIKKATITGNVVT